MKLAKEITIIPPSYLMNDQIVHPNPLKIDSLKMSYTDIPVDQLVYATIENFPAGFLLWQNDDYINDTVTWEIPNGVKNEDIKEISSTGGYHHKYLKYKQKCDKFSDHRR